MPSLKFLLLAAVAVFSHADGQEEVAVSVDALGGAVTGALDAGVAGLVDSLLGTGDRPGLQALLQAAKTGSSPQAGRHLVRRPHRPTRVPRKNNVAEAIDNISDQLSTSLINSFQRLVDALDSLSLTPKVVPAENKSKANTSNKSNST